MGIVIDPEERHVLKIDDCRFTVRGLTGREVLRLSRQLSSVDSDADGIFDVLHVSLLEWTGVTDRDGKALEVTAENVDRLPLETAVKIFEKIASLSGLEGADQGN